MTGRHTYFAMAVTAVYALVLLLSLAALYKKLAPRDHGTVLNATSKFNPDLVNQEDPTGIYTTDPPVHVQSFYAFPFQFFRVC